MYTNVGLVLVSIIVHMVSFNKHSLSSFVLAEVVFPSPSPALVFGRSVNW